MVSRRLPHRPQPSLAGLASYRVLYACWMRYACRKRFACWMWFACRMQHAGLLLAAFCWLVLPGKALADSPPPPALFFQVAPGICVVHDDSPCQVQLSVRWQQAQEACLYRLDTGAELGCGRQQQLQLALTLSANLLLELRARSSGKVLQHKVIRRMQQLEDADTIKPRRLSWSLF